MAIPKSIDARRFYRCANRRGIEAGILFEADQPTGAIYMAGYVVECMLKALIIESRPDRFRGDLLEQLKRIGHNITRLLDIYYQSGGSRPPVVVLKAFTLVGEWSSEMRYDPRESPPSDAEKFLKAVAQINQWIDGRI